MRQIILFIFFQLVFYFANAQVSDTILKEMNKDIAANLRDSKPVIVTSLQMSAKTDFEKGFALNGEGKNREAVEFLLKAIGIDEIGNCGSGVDGSAYNELGYAYSTLVQPDSALYYLTKSIAVNPINPKPYLNKFLLLNKKHKSEQAIQVLQDMVSNLPNFTSVYAELGILYQRNNQNDLALAAYKKYIEVIEKLNYVERSKILFEEIQKRIDLLEHLK